MVEINSIQQKVKRKRDRERERQLPYCILYIRTSYSFHKNAFKIHIIKRSSHGNRFFHGHVIVTSSVVIMF